MALIIYIISIALSGIALFLGLSSNMFGLFKNPTSAQFASFATGIFIIIIGDRLASFLHDRDLLNKFSEKVMVCFRRVPHMNVIEEFTTSDDAMNYVASRIPDCRSILNTKISKDSIEPRRDVSLIYTKVLKKALKNGLSYRDIISPGFESYSNDLRQHSNECNGTYDYCIQKDISSSFLNFIVLHFKDDNAEPELIIGWATSSIMGTDHKAFKIKDQRIINYFAMYHQSLSV